VMPRGTVKARSFLALLIQEPPRNTRRFDRHPRAPCFAPSPLYSVRERAGVRGSFRVQAADPSPPARRDSEA
jgi:hypothetical protein